MCGFANVQAIDTSAFAFAGTGAVDLTNNAMVVRGGNLAAVTAAITSGLYTGTGGYWDGAGINSSVAAADGSFLTGLGVLDNSLALYPDFAGVMGLTGAEILVKYTYYGDSDLSGTVTGDDFNLFLTGFNDPMLSGWVWGDYDYSGSITGDDFNLFLNAFNNQGGPLRDPTLAAQLNDFGAQLAVAPAGGSDPAAAQAVVPEPGSFALLTAGAIGLLGRRRKKKIGRASCRERVSVLV